MPAHLPIPRSQYPRNEQEFTTLSERLGGRVWLKIGDKVEKTVVEDGTPVTRRVPAFIEWWLEYQADFIPPNQSEPSAPSDPHVRELLVAIAGIAARSWSAEIEAAKGWPARATPSGTGTPQPVFTPPMDKGSRK